MLPTDEKGANAQKKAVPASRPASTYVDIYDTTLRDGTQGLGFTLSLEDKIRILQALDRIGVDYVEGGYPYSNPKDSAFFNEARGLRLNRTKLAAFGMTRRKGYKAEDDAGLASLLAADTPVVTIVGKTWDFHVREVLRVDLDENLRMIADSVRFLHKKGRELVYDAEHFFDAYKANPDYSMRALEAAAEAGASVLCLCDTNGGSLVHEVGDAVEAVVARFPGVGVGIHTHNDAGLAVANALEAVRRGATQVQGTVNGVGERCGNVDLIPVIANLALKMNRDVLDGAASVAGLTELSRFVYRIADREPFIGQPYVGPAAFAHKGGMHVHAVQRNVATYEHVPPESVGNERRILVSELSGVSNIRELTSELLGDRRLEPAELKEILETVSRLEKAGFAFEDAEASFELLVLRVLGQFKPRFLVDHYQCGVFRAAGSSPITTGLLTLRVNGEVCRGTSEGEDPLAALEGALRRALAGHYPRLASIKLDDRKFRAIERPGERATRVRVTTRFSDGTRFWTTVAVGQNVIDAGLECLVEGFEYYLMQSERGK
jgi:2-isopropylmalate synthase